VALKGTLIASDDYEGNRRRSLNDEARLSDAVRQTSDPLHLMQRVADQACALVQGAEGVFIGLWDEGDFVTYVCGAGFLGPHVGLKIHVSNSLSGAALRSGQILRSDDTSRDPRVDADACQEVGVLSAICVPLMRGDRAFGVMNVSASRPQAFDIADELILSGLGEFLSVVVAAAVDLERVSSALLSGWSLPSEFCDSPLPEKVDPKTRSRFVANVLSPHIADRLAARERIERALEPGAFSLFFQPVVDLEGGQYLGFEALTRFRDQPTRPPDAWFAEAQAVGLGVELELAAFGLALDHLPRLPEGALMGVNVGPEAIVSEDMLRLLLAADSRRVVVELTEHIEISDYPRLIQALSAIRAMGARLAIDDTGTGISGLVHILKLAPEFIKLDRALTSGIDHDPVRRALATSLVTFAAETGSLIIAEGIETAEELAALRGLGIRYGQGFYLARPSPHMPSAMPTHAGVRSA
jgi:EAL domain-containing protein (putative c-di-GMP-specific phosphodiesterase class I)/putative methionine-R-sulfoxide reductase with GAF domain